MASKLRIAITGAHGQLGQCLKHLSSQFDYVFLFTDRDTIDITSTESLETTLGNFNPEIIINAA